MLKWLKLKVNWDGLEVFIGVRDMYIKILDLMVTMEVEYFNLDGKADQSLEWITKLIHHHQDCICILEI